MKNHYHYETVTEAIEQLREQGYTLDFNLEENCIVCDTDKFSADEFDIVEIYRYEGDSDPADEATVYGIQSKSGIKGILVTGFGNSSDNSMTNEILKKLKI
ncbi:hypothetical protein ACQ33O_00750 [Ferruginibacter sp. SUN002]|uniref:hypothetical protein n=1 Tax=Ferruginibacter sp. SUN002 TaxID=2937789 RepID=UPI003D360274